MSEDTNSIYCNATGPILLSYEKSLLTGPPNGELFNDYGFVVRARAEAGEDIHLWSFIYQQTGPEVIIDGDVSQTLLVYGKFTDEEKQYMHPEMPTVNKGQNIEDYYPPGSIKVREGKDDVTWTLGERVHHGTPTKWHVSGEHAGVKIDVIFEQRNPAFYHCGRFENLKEGNTGTAGYIVHTTASGTIEAHGKALKFTNGHGIHERIIQNGKVPDRTSYMAGRGLHWMHGFSEGFTWYLMRGDIGKGMGTAMINIGGEQIVLHNPSSSGVEEAAHWIDPISKIISPYKWRAWVRTDQGVLEARINAYGRAYYTWIRRGGTLVVNQYCADAETTFTYPDGRIVEAKQMVSIEHMRTLYRQLSSLQNN